MNIEKSYKSTLKMVGYFVMIMLLSISCKAQNDTAAINLVNLLVKKDGNAGYYTARFSVLGKAAIPYLIDKIDTNEKDFIGYGDPMSSQLIPNYNYTGIRAAYMIEYLLSDMKKERVYRLCLILKVVNNQLSYKGLIMSDMDKIKEIYFRWWNLNKLKIYKELKAEWLKNKRPLISTDYAWQ